MSDKLAKVIPFPQRLRDTKRMQHQQEVREGTRNFISGEKFFDSLFTHINNGLTYHVVHQELATHFGEKSIHEAKDKPLAEQLDLLYGKIAAFFMFFKVVDLIEAFELGQNILYSDNSFEAHARKTKLKTLYLMVKTIATLTKMESNQDHVIQIIYITTPKLELAVLIEEYLGDTALQAYPDVDQYLERLKAFKDQHLAQ